MTETEYDFRVQDEGTVIILHPESFGLIVYMLALDHWFV